jgi:hypothetical protein
MSSASCQAFAVKPFCRSLKVTLTVQMSTHFYKTTSNELQNSTLRFSLNGLLVNIIIRDHIFGSCSSLIFTDR